MNDVDGPNTGGQCTCVTSGRTHKRECLLSLRKCYPRQAALSVPPSGSPTAGGNPTPPCVNASPKHIPIKGIKSSPTKSPVKDTRPQMKIGDHVYVHCSFMGRFHLPCRIVGEFDGHYQLYCAKGILITSFCATELTQLAIGSLISLENWREAPKVLLQSAADDTTIECCNCDLPACFDSTVISSGSEGESEAPRIMGKQLCL